MYTCISTFKTISFQLHLFVNIFLTYEIVFFLKIFFSGHYFTRCKIKILITLLCGAWLYEFFLKRKNNHQGHLLPFISFIVGYVIYELKFVNLEAQYSKLATTILQKNLEENSYMILSSPNHKWIFFLQSRNFCYTCPKHIRSKKSITFLMINKIHCSVTHITENQL